MMFLKQNRRSSCSSNEPASLHEDEAESHPLHHYHQQLHHQNRWPHQKSHCAAKKIPLNSAVKQASQPRTLIMDSKALRFGKVLLTFVIVIFLVQVSQLVTLSIYSNGLYLHYLYGNADKVEWKRCSNRVVASTHSSKPSAAMGTSLIGPSQIVILNSTQVDSINYSLFSPVNKNWKKQLLTLLEVFRFTTNSFDKVSQLDKRLVVLISHTSFTASLLFLVVSLLPYILRCAKNRFLILLSLLISLIAFFTGLTAAIASLFKIIIYGAAQLSTPASIAFSFVPQCHVLRKIFFCTECFCLLIVLAALLTVTGLIVIFCRTIIRVDEDSLSNADDTEYHF